MYETFKLENFIPHLYFQLLSLLPNQQHQNSAADFVVCVKSAFVLTPLMWNYCGCQENLGAENRSVAVYPGICMGLIVKW